MAALEMTGDDNESTGDTWIALAVVQWKTGRLIPEVKERALEAIAAETQERWIESGLWNRRRKVLARTVTMLQSPQRSPVKIGRELRAMTPYEPGDVLRFRMTSGMEVALWAMHNSSHEGLSGVRSTVTYFQLLGFGEPRLDSVEDLVAKPPPELVDGQSNHRYVLEFSFHLPQDAQGERWDVVAQVPFPGEREVGSYKLINLRQRGRTATQIADDRFHYAYEACRRARDA